MLMFLNAWRHTRRCCFDLLAHAILAVGGLFCTVGAVLAAIFGVLVAVLVAVLDIAKATLMTCSEVFHLIWTLVKIVLCCSKPVFVDMQDPRDVREYLMANRWWAKLLLKEEEDEESSN